MFRQFHVGLALFFMPFVLLFVLTGVLHLLGSKESNLEEIKLYDYVQGENFQTLDSKLALQNACKKQIANVKYKFSKKRYMRLETKDMIATLEPQPKGYRIVISKRTIFGKLLNLHKGKYLSGKIASYGFAAGIICLLISGIMMINRRKNRIRNYILVCLGFGVIAGLCLSSF